MAKAKSRQTIILPKNPVKGMRQVVSVDIDKKPPHKYGNRGKYTHTGHVPEHARAAMDKRAAAWKKEKQRLADYQARRAEARMASQ
eukprot:CAMPEP_0184291122 /NCGR_PEP_ID=MMETSP1049-20130417/3199_1 /TAXON_ID=77928 /ORGANISM="Proteomonas sulcata, Strain CCMP704" /LENGTH=85 /DNA_ID=CAMNT_0026598465 /DNA_START=89 /DNA_END=346 /DNA_ORIENTATION=-